MLKIQEHVYGKGFNDFEYFLIDRSETFNKLQGLEDEAGEILGINTGFDLQNREKVNGYIILPIDFKDEIGLQSYPLNDISYDGKVWLIDTGFGSETEIVKDGLLEESDKANAYHARLIGFDNTHAEPWYTDAKEGLELIAEDIKETYNL